LGRAGLVNNDVVETEQGGTEFTNVAFTEKDDE
jgi:hypothetical protein